MKRKGAQMVLTAVIIIVILLIFAGLISWLMTGNLSMFDDFSEGSISGSERTLCMQNVEQFCRDNPGADWTSIHSECTDIQDVIDEQVGGSGGECPS